MLKIILCIVITFFYNFSPAQHDLDSLYKYSTEFRKIWKIVADTFDLFASESVLDVAITADFRMFNRKKDTLNYQDAIFSIYDRKY